MDGTLAHRELTSRGLCFRQAAPRDEASLRELLREASMDGGIQLTLEREPDYFQSIAATGGESLVLVGLRGERVVAMGRCVRRKLWLGGAPTEINYLAELRVGRGERAPARVLREGYLRIAEELGDARAQFAFTSIAAANTRARRFLERQLPGMPRYSPVGEYTTLVLAPPRQRGRWTDKKLEMRTAAPGDADEICDFLNEHGRTRSLSTVWDSAELARRGANGCSLRDMMLFTHGSQLVGVVGFWDQRRFRQTVIRGYSRGLRVLRPLWNLLAPAVRGVRLPRVGEALGHAFLSPFAFAPSSEAMAPQAIAAASRLAVARGVNALTIGGTKSDPMIRAISSAYSTRKYETILYRVDWRGAESETAESAESVVLPQSVFSPEVALL